MNGLREVISQLRNVTNALEVVANDMDNLESHCQYLEGEISRNNDLKRKMIELLQEDLRLID